MRHYRQHVCPPRLVSEQGAPARTMPTSQLVPEDTSAREQHVLERTTFKPLARRTETCTTHAYKRLQLLEHNVNHLVPELSRSRLQHREASLCASQDPNRGVALVPQWTRAKTLSHVFLHCALDPRSTIISTTQASIAPVFPGHELSPHVLQRTILRISIFQFAV